MTQLLLPIIYLAFISLGLPDSLLGSAWPTMYPQLGVPFSYAGILSMIISLGTIVSSLNSDRLTRALGTGRVTALSVGMTAAALFGFSVSGQFWMLCLWAIPYGLGAGSVDAALNNYVALHYESRHMSWLHCMWGVGTTIGPVVMGVALSGGLSWNSGYRYIALFQIALTAVLFCSLPLWHKRPDATPDGTVPKALTLPQVFALPGAKEVMLCFFCYCALETTAGLWASSYLTLVRQVPAQTAASFASLFYIGISTAQEALKRIENRVAKGGHNIPEQDVLRRFEERCTALAKVLDYVDEAVLYDNENGFVVVAEYRNGEIVPRGSYRPAWLEELQRYITG